MKKLSVIAISLILLFPTAFLYLNYRPVNIIAVHHSEVFSHIIVDHMPLTNKQKIKWWKDNEKDIFREYNIPKIDREGMFRIYFWVFGDGYKESGKYDRLCFDDIPEPKNCIDKNNPMTVAKTREGNIRYTFNYSIYIQASDGSLKKQNNVMLAK